MTLIFSTSSFVVKADLTLAHSFSCSNLCLVCVCVIYKIFLWVGTISCLVLGCCKGALRYICCSLLSQGEWLYEAASSWCWLMLRNGNSSIGKTGIDMVIAFSMPEIEGSCCIPWPLVVENHCLGCSLLKQMLLWSMYFLCSTFFYVLSSFSTETGTFQTPCSLKSCSIAPNAITIISSCTYIVDCQSLSQSASYVLPMFEIRIPCIHIKTWYPNQADQVFSPCS